MHEAKRLTVVQTNIASVEFTMNAAEISLLRRIIGGIDVSHGLIGASADEAKLLIAIHQTLAVADDEIKRMAMRPYAYTTNAKKGG